jgi:hypothetical protein
MPFVDGESLQQRMTSRGRAFDDRRLPPPRGIADALAYAHAHGSSSRRQAGQHHDRREHAVLVDFGVAQAVVEAIDTRITGTGHYVGTTQYMAPEQFAASSDVDGRADVYALGVVIFEVLTGRSAPREIIPRRRSRGRIRHPRIARGLRSRRCRSELSDLVEKGAGAGAGGSGWPAPRRFATASRRRSSAATAVLSRALALRAPARGGSPSRCASGADGSRPAVDDDRVAIAPFTSCGDFALWREGFVDVLSANLDGAGPLRTVPPSVVMRSWRGMPDVESGHRIRGAHRRTLRRARPRARGGTRLRARVGVARRRRTPSAREPIELRDATERMDRIADALALALLRDIGAVRPVSAIPHASMGSGLAPGHSSLPAGRAAPPPHRVGFGAAAYSRALALDSNFALAQSHIGLSYGWQRFGSDSLARMHALRAGALNVGLGPRDSMLIVADSLRSVAYAYAGDPQYHAHVARSSPRCERRPSRYELDAESGTVWPTHTSISASDPGSAFRGGDPPHLRSLDLPRFRLRHRVHPSRGARVLVGDSAARPPYARRYFALLPGDVSAAGTLLATRLMSGASGDDARGRQTVDTASADLLFQAYSAARRASIAPASRSSLRAMRRTPRDYAPLADPAFARQRLALQLSYRGRFRRGAGARRSTAEQRARGDGAGERAIEPSARPVLAEWLRTDPREPTSAHRSSPPPAPCGRSSATRRRFARCCVAPRRRPLAAPCDSQIARYSAAVAAPTSPSRAVTPRNRSGGSPRCPTRCVECVPCRGSVRETARVDRTTSRGRRRFSSIGRRCLPSAIDVLWALERARVAETTR